MKKNLLLLVFVLVLALSACGNSEGTDITVSLDWTPNTNHTGLYVALEKGYFDEVGLNVDIIQPDSTSDILVATNTVQFGVSAQEYVLSARANGMPVVSIASIIYDNSSGFISKTSSNILRPKDFENKTYCGWGGDTESAIIKEMVEADGGDFSLVEITTNYLSIFTDVNNECDFFWVFEAWQVEEAKLSNIDYNYLSMVDYSSDLNFHTPVITTNEDMINNNKDIVEKFMSAVTKGYNYAIDNPAESAQILLKYAPELNEELVIASQTFISSIYQGEDVIWGMQSEDYWTNFTAWLVDNDILDEIIVSEAFTNEFINE
ncbi:MAG: ABC transporter substrate-binding protein [Candidatus Izemoplasma sp.]